ADEACDPSTSLTPFYRAYSASAIDHYYTTSSEQLNNAVTNHGYVFQGVTGNVLASQSNITDSEPLYRLYSSTATDHFYTASAAQLDTAVNTHGFTFEAVQAWIYPSQVCGSIPLLRNYNAQGTDHFYTTNETEYESAVAGGDKGEGVVGHVLPA
ncbi:uncharacterized protein STEHIDRAFT_59836, partial [Stereum hirsutum FP-91666 SS1]|uniref:uncharacterized protein n=1 Tax=Stereum hirsutum (strain FP-91666) TaxID=721885 RepID=UPI00044496BD